MGSLNFPPRPPGSLHKFAVSSVQVSITSFPSNASSKSDRKNSAPMILRSKDTLCPTTKFTLFKANLNLFNTSNNGDP